jgi:tetratricopeptide (TPR) repeat protein
MAAFALIKRAESLRTELHYRSGTINTDDFTNQMNQAKDSYTKAFEKSSDNPALAAAAKLGIGLCEEGLGNFDQARLTYEEIAATPEFEGTVAIAQARRRLFTMADYQQKVGFRQSPKQAPPILAPVIKPGVPQGFQAPTGTSEAPVELNLPGQP